MITKAVHLELASDLTPSSIAGMTCFLARKGMVHMSLSDNGTNFMLEHLNSMIAEALEEITKTENRYNLLEVPDDNKEINIRINGSWCNN